MPYMRRSAKTEIMRTASRALFGQGTATSQGKAFVKRSFSNVCVCVCVHHQLMLSRWKGYLGPALEFFLRDVTYVKRMLIQNGCLKSSQL